jgi:hypothetical protein
MYLENPAFRKLLRSVIASIFDEYREAWNEVIKKFGLDKKKATEAGEFIWKNRNSKPFSSIGIEEVPMRTIENSSKKLLHEKQPVNINNLIQAVMSYAPEKGLPAMPPKLSDNLINSLVQKYGPNKDIVNKLEDVYNDINAGYKADNYLQIVENPSIQKKLGPEGPEYSKVPIKDVLDKRTEEYSGPEIPEYKKLPKKYASTYQPLRLRQLNVVLRYIDSFEN